MKRIILPLLLAAVLMISGCAYDALPEIFAQPVPHPVLAESLIARVQNNIDTNAFEGFTGESTFGDVLAKAEPDKLDFAKIEGNIELSGYAVSVVYTFDDNIGGKLLLSRMELTVYPRGQQSEQEFIADLLAKMDGDLGSHEQSPYGESYHWQGMTVSLSLDGVNAKIFLQGQGDARFPESPDFLPCQLGADISAAYSSLIPCALPEGAEAQRDSLLYWHDKGIIVQMGFKTDEKTGAITPWWGDYNIFLNKMELNESIDYFESVANGLESEIGAPDGREYEVRHPSDNGMPPVWEGGNGKLLSSQDILESGNMNYRLKMTWPGIYFEATMVYMNICFNDKYFNADNK